MARIVEQSPASVVITDTKGDIQYVNRRFTEVTGYSKTEVMGKNPRFLKSGEKPPEEYRTMWETIISGAEWRGEFHNRKKSGELYWEYASINAIRDKSGAITNFLAVKEEITGLKKLQEELTAAKDAAESASLAKDRFLATMSHELRTPLNSIIGFSNVLLKNKAGNLGSKEIDYLARILENGKSLLTLINGILDLSKVEAGKMELDMSGVDLKELIEGVLAKSEGQIGGKALLLEASIPDTLAPVHTDRAKLEQVLFNLLGNAIKFTDSGKVSVIVDMEPQTCSPVRINIADTGIGIPGDKVELIFEPFVQADTTTSRKYGGTGLGLAISRSLLKLLGFDLEVKSVPGTGSVFSIIMKHTV